MSAESFIDGCGWVTYLNLIAKWFLLHVKSESAYCSRRNPSAFPHNIKSCTMIHSCTDELYHM